MKQTKIDRQEEMMNLLSDELIEQAASLSAATLHEAAGRKGALPAVLKPVDRRMRVCGRALPIRCPAGDNLWIHRALASASRGDVLVVDTGSGSEFGYWGEIMATSAVALGISGLVIMGGVRDVIALAELRLPTFSSCISIRGTRKDPGGDGTVGEPVRIGEVVVSKGDLVSGDADGVVVLTPEVAKDAIPASLARARDEVGILKRVRGGELTLVAYKI